MRVLGARRKMPFSELGTLVENQKKEINKSNTPGKAGGLFL
jgi:hypothetical protein